MHHKEFLKSLNNEDRMHLNTKSDLIGLCHLLTHWGLIICCAVLIEFAIPGWEGILIIQGILIVFLFTLLHETSHLTPFKTSKLNTIVGHVCGFLIFLPANWFRYFHFTHHRYTHDPEKDPELASPKPDTLIQYVLHISGLPTWYSQLHTLFRNAAGQCNDEFVPSGKYGLVKREARLMLLVYAFLVLVSVLGESMILLYIWIIPVLLGQPFLRLYLLAEHGRCPHVSNMFENTRTTFTSWIVLKLAWNMPYHAEHHTVPTVPFHRLPDLHKLTSPHLQETEQGYARFHAKYCFELNE